MLELICVEVRVSSTAEGLLTVGNGLSEVRQCSSSSRTGRQTVFEVSSLHPIGGIHAAYALLKIVSAAFLAHTAELANTFTL